MFHSDLSNNEITSIASGAFTELGNLASLYVGVVNVLLSCSHIWLHSYLYSNRIMSIPIGAFTGLDNLTALCDMSWGFNVFLFLFKHRIVQLSA